MADTQHSPDKGNDPATGPHRGPTGRPRWVKVFGIVAAVVLLLLVVMILAGHGPGNHAPSADAGGEAHSVWVGDGRNPSAGDMSRQPPLGAAGHGGSHP